MLADKLLSNMDFDTDKEIRNLELLKLRFGEASLHSCEIMVRVDLPRSPPRSILLVPPQC